MSRDQKQHTPGPWAWRVNRSARQVELVARHSGTLLVMDFDRWGMQRAEPRFRDSGLMVNARELTATIPGEEHNEHWYRTLEHPDARLIAAAPTMLAALQKLMPFCDEGDVEIETEWQRAVADARAAIAIATVDPNAALPLSSTGGGGG
jgi:hypothetical protein